MALVNPSRSPGRKRRWLTIAGLLVLAALGWLLWHQYDQWWCERQGLNLLADGDFAAAAQELESAAARYPSDEQLAFLAAVAHRRQGNLQKFEAFLRQAERLGWSEKECSLQRLLARTQHGLGDRASEEALNAICLQEGTDDFTAEQIYEARAKGYMSLYQAHAAYQALEFWIRWKPKAVAPRFLRAQLYEQEDDGARAQQDYQAIVDSHPEHFEARLRLAEMLNVANRHSEARKHFRKCAETAPQDPRVMMGLAEIEYGRVEDSAGVEATLEKLLARDLDKEVRLRALRLLAGIYLDRKEYDRVVALLQDTADRGELNVPGFQALIHAYTQLRQPEKAQQYRRLHQRDLKLRNDALALDRQIWFNPRDPDLRYRQGKKFQEAGDKKSAMTWWYTAILAEPLHQPSHEALAEMFLAQGDAIRAAQHQRSAEESVERTFHLAWSAYTREDLNFVAEAIPEIAKYPAYKPHAQLLACAVEVHQKQRQFDPARLKTLQPLLDYPRLRNNTLIVLGSAMFQLGRFGEAEAALQEAVRTDPQSIMAHRWLAAMYFDIRALERLAMHCEKWANLDKTDYRPHRLIGLESKLRQAFTPAVRAYQESLLRDPNQPTRQQVLNELAECQYRLGKPEEAIRTLDKATASVARDVMLAQCYWAVQRKADAQQLLAKCLERDEKNRLANTLSADIAIQASELELAMKHLQVVTEAYPFEHTGWFKLSQVYSRLKQPDKAREASLKAEQLRKIEERYVDTMEKALKLPDDVPIRRALEAGARQMGRPDLAEEWKRAADLLESRSSPPTDPANSRAAPLAAENSIPLIEPRRAAPAAAGSAKP